jgi:hypothetical protein
MTMKKRLLSGALRKVFALAFLSAFIAGSSLTQTGENSAKILQKCVDLPDLQKYFQDANGSLPGQLYVMQHGISFDPGISVTWNGKPLVFMEKQQIVSNGIDDYFLFHTFEISENSARVDFVYNFKDATNQSKLVRVLLDFEKEGVSWNIVQHKMLED